MPPNVAIALFVKDEFSDIAGWIAWHAALGVQTFFIYDDHSTDGTWEILQAAAKCYDIRLRRTDPLTVPHFADRQRDAYMQTVQEAKGAFDWLGFLDGDEYLYLKHFDHLPEFLLHFSHADAIGFSWRIYGSSERVIRPHEHIVRAFTQHSSKDFFDNKHIKSFVRPEKMGTKWIDPHYFDIPQENYVAPSGRFLKNFGAKQEVEWSDAFVMHFICRSMEHYVQRVKRRINQDLSDTTAYWHYFNRNEETDFEPLRLIPQMERKLAPIVQECLKLAIQKLKDLPLTPAPKLYSVKKGEAQKPLKCFKLVTHEEASLYYSPKLGQVVHALEAAAKDKGLLPIHGCVDPGTPSLITLYLAKETNPQFLKFPEDSRLSRKIIYRLTSDDKGNHALLDPITNRFMTFLPLDGGVGTIEVNRKEVKAWEHIQLKKTSKIDPPLTLTKLPFVPNGKTSAYRVLNWIKTAEKTPDPETFLKVFYNLSAIVQQEISNYIPGLLWEIL